MADGSLKSRVRTFFLLAVAGSAGLAFLCAGVLGPCFSRWATDGILVDTCPAGKVRPVGHIEVDQVGRGDWGRVTVYVDGHYLELPGGPRTTRVRRFSTTLVALDPAGKESPVELKRGWSDQGGQAETAMVKLPDGPDGEWTLRAKIDSAAGEVVAEVKLPLYAPALAHVATSSPLYKPGQSIQFRGVLLHERDLTPLAGRPGVWKVYSPEGDLLLEEKGVASAMGVVASSFPLDPAATAGTWRVRFESGAASEEVAVEVREFQLPRFTVEAKSARRWWARGEGPVVTGQVRYTSGAPVRNAPLRISFGGQDGAWPPPPGWKQDVQLVTDSSGHFRWALPVVPGDLQGVAALRYGLVATEPAGTVARGGFSVILAEDPIVASAVTELQDGLVPDANNRMYVRVTTPDGEPLRGRSVTLRKEWDSDDVGAMGVADADGVAKFQVDPGQPITVVQPAMPVRPEPREAAAPLAITGGRDILTGDSLSVEERVYVDGWATSLLGCADRIEHGTEAAPKLVAWIGADGRVRRAVGALGEEPDPLGDCLAARASGLRGPGGRERLWSLDLHVRDPEVPSYEVSASADFGSPDEVESLVSDALRSARCCIAGVTSAGELPTRWVWSQRRGEAGIVLSPVPTPPDTITAYGASIGCVSTALAGLRREEPAEVDAMGALEVQVLVPGAATPAQPEPTTFPGFAFKVVAASPTGPTEATTLRMRPGAIPALRVRFNEVIVDPGATVEVTAVRGPGAPTLAARRLELMQADRKVLTFDFDPTKRTGSFSVPKEVHGFLSVDIAGVRGILYVRSPNELAVSVAPDRTSYRPGDQATLTVTTGDSQGPVAAGVLVSGVDSTLGALAALPGPDDFARTVVRATSDAPAFAVWDARALQTGQIAGENAAQAAVLRISGLPPAPPGAARASASAESPFDRDGEVQDSFYALYREVRGAVRSWERSAPEAEVMTPAKMVEIWEAALKQHPALDPFGNPLHLSQVPRDLLALTDPRVMVADAARLPEDVEDWAAYVSREAP